MQDNKYTEHLKLQVYSDQVNKNSKILLWALRCKTLINQYMKTSKLSLVFISRSRNSVLSSRTKMITVISCTAFNRNLVDIIECNIGRLTIDCTSKLCKYCLIYTENYTR